jgi:hypothetical protein
MGLQYKTGIKATPLPFDALAADSEVADKVLGRTKAHITKAVNTDLSEHLAANFTCVLSSDWPSFI